MSGPGQRLLAVSLVGLVWLALLASGTGFVGVAAAGNQVDVAASDLPGSGTSDDPYQISNASELQAMEDDLSANYTLVSDVDAAETESWNGGKGFDPIGDSSTKFTGSFDGQGHSISNLTINRSGTENVGLFGIVGEWSGDGGTVSNVSLHDVNVTGNDNVGSLVGIHNDDSLRNVSASGNVTGVSSTTDDSNFIGGLVGFSYGTITDASATVNVSGSEVVGGLVGINRGSGLVTNASAAGTVSGSDWVGGLVGENDGTVSDSYATGNVSGNENVGGLIGYNDLTVNNSEASGDVTGSENVSGLVGWNTGTITHTHASGTVTASNSSGESINAGGLAGYNDHNVTNSSFTGSVSGETDVGGLVGYHTGNLSDVYVTAAVSGDTNVDPVVGNTAGSGTVTDGYWNTEVTSHSSASHGTALTTAEMTGMNATRTMGGLTFYDPWVPTNSDYPELTWQAGTDGTTASAFDCYFVGNGSESAPYQVETAPELQSMNDLAGANYTLTSDVDASETKTWNGGAGFDPIGDFDDKFVGSFNGQGHAITNLTINRPSSSDDVGLFGMIGGSGAISNLSLLEGNITGDSDVGGVVGTNRGGNVENASATGTVDGTGNVGGLVGDNYNDNSNVTDSATSVTVTGSDSRVGGLIGTNEGTVDTSYATGDTSGSSDRVGGLVGSNSGTVSNSYATGNISGSSYVGGLIGYQYSGSTVAGSYAAGNVTGDSSDGGLVGYNGGTVTDSYWDTEATGRATSDGSATGLTTAKMTGIDAISNMDGFDFLATWKATSGYPTLRTSAEAGTADDPYTISNVYNLQVMNQDLDAHYVLVSDIDASGTENWNGGKGFDPIGDGTTPFTGTFDGQGYTISDLTINRSTENDVGLFGRVNVGTVSNVTVSAVDVTGDEKVGSVVGYVNGGSVRNVSAAGSVNGTAEIGGLVGFFDGSVITNSSASVATRAAAAPTGSQVGGIVGAVYKGDVSNVSASGSVSGTGGYAGGLVGEYNEGTLSNVTATGDVSDDEKVGGLVGSTTSAVDIRNSSATGDVNGSSEVGGLVGHNNQGTVADSFSTGAVSATDPDTVGGFVGQNDGTITDTYWRDTTDNPDTAFGDGTGDAIGLTTAEMTGMNATRNMANLPFYAAWVPTKGDYPEPAALAGTDGTTASAFDRYFPGNGTEANPYEIETAPELRAINDSLAANYTLRSDIDAAETASWNDGAGFDPVGPNRSTAFVGSFDGRGNSISNLAINRSSTDRVGLFGVIGDSGTVTNVSVSSVDVDGRDNVGGLAGDVFEGTVRNVSVSGTVNGSGTVGGLAGYLYNGSATESSSTVTVSGDVDIGGLVGLVRDGNASAVHASGTVRGPTNNVEPGEQNVGGLVGRYSGGTIHNASASGDVSGPVYVGGLIGNADGSTNATNVSAVGDVNANDISGGLVGSNDGTVRDAFAAGAVTGSTTGGLVGDNDAQGSITDAYWDTTATGASSATGENAGSVDATGLTTAEMTGAAAAENMANLTFDDPWLTTHGYPVLRDHVTDLGLELGTTSLTEGDTTDATVTLSLFGGRTETASMVAEYTTTDAGIADVDGGTLAANGPGEATITASHAVASDSIDVDVSASNAGGGGGGGGATGGAPGTDTGNDRTTVEAEPTMENGVSVATVSVSANAEQAVEIQLGSGDDGSRDGAGEGSSETVRATVETLDIEFADDTEGDVSISQSASPPAPDAPEFDVDSADPAGYLRVETDIDNEQITRAEIGFRVSRSALDTAGTDAGDVSLYHYDEDAGEWDALSTEIAETSGSEVRFTAVTLGFSDFVIGVGDQQPDDDPERTTESSQSTTNSTESSGERATESDRSTGATDTARSNGSPAVFEWVLAMIAVAVGALAVLWRRNSDI